MIISDDHIGNILQMLSETDKQVALLRGRCKTAERMKKIAFAKAYLKAQGTQDARKAQAEIDEGYQDACQEEIDVGQMKDEIEEMRRTGQSHISVWQTEHADRRKGAVF